MDSEINWKPIPSPIHQRIDGTATILRGDDGQAIGVALVGGRDPNTNDAISTAELLEWKLHQWWTLPNLLHARAECAVASLADTIFAVGGVDKSGNVLDTVEFWKLSGDANSSWQTVPIPMSTPRWGCAVVGMSRQGLLVVIGGRNANWQSVTSVEAYDIEQQRWKILQSLATPRFGCAAVAIGPSRIMIMGGYDGTNFLSSCRVYDIEEDEWTDVPSMPLPCVFGSATVVMRDSRFVLVMGHTTTTAAASASFDNSSRNDAEAYSFATATNKVIQCYCVKYRKWKVLKTSQAIESGHLMAIGEDLIAVGTKPNTSSERRSRAKGKSMKTNRSSTNQVYRQCNLINLNLGGDDEFLSLDSKSGKDPEDWRHRSHHSAGDASALSLTPSLSSPNDRHRSMVRARTMPYLPTSLTTNIIGQVALSGTVESFETHR